MKVIIAGSRSLNPSVVELTKFLDLHGILPTEIVCGTARGVDAAGEAWAYQNWIPVMKFKPNWLKYGLSAGPIRNQQMAEYADVLCAYWDGSSKGTADMIGRMTAAGKKVYIFNVNQHLTKQK